MLYKKELTGTSVGVVFGTFAPLHRGHIDTILRAKKENDGGALVVLSGKEGDRGERAGMPVRKRYRYVLEHFKNDPLVVVTFLDEISCPGYPGGWSTWIDRVKDIWDAHTIGEPQRIWYCANPEYSDRLYAELGEKVVLTDTTLFPASGAQIRQNPLRYWDYIAPPFRRFFTKNVLVAGAASGGKTTLVEDLAKLYNAPYSHEYAREYQINANIMDEDYDFLDYQNVFTGQYQINREAIDSPGNRGLTLMDTDAMVTKCYAMMAAADPHSALTAQEYEKLVPLANSLIQKARWDLILFIPPVIEELTADSGFRSPNNHSSSYLTEFSTRMLLELSAAGLSNKLVLLSGNDYGERYKQAKKAIQDIL